MELDYYSLYFIAGIMWGTMLLVYCIFSRFDINRATPIGIIQRTGGGWATLSLIALWPLSMTMLFIYILIRRNK